MPDPDPTIAVGPADDAGCGHYRLIFPARVLADQGADVTIDDQGPQVIWDRDWSHLSAPPPEARVVDVRPYPADILVIQRPARRWWADIIPLLQQSGTRVVVDMDDRMDRIHPDHVGVAQHDPAVVNWHNHRWADLACQRADLVTATTPALLDRYAYGRYAYGHGLLLPNLVPASYLNVDAPKLDQSIGWTGEVVTHPGDLETPGGAVATTLSTQLGWTFHAVGTGNGVAAALHLAEEPTATGWVPFADYPARYAALEIAIVPLADSPFNRAKSALKMIEAAALGVPVIASRTPDNVRMHDHGVGVLASTPNQWHRQLRRLTASAELRTDLAGQGRAVMARHTYERCAERWWSAWTSTLKIRSRSAA